MSLLELLRKIFCTKQEKPSASHSEMDNVVASMFLCQPIYDNLKVLCHPDRYSNDRERRQQATEFFQELQKNKHNLTKLKETEKEILLWLQNQ